MRVSFPVEVRFEHVIRDANGKPDKTHLTMNGAPLCEIVLRHRLGQVGINLVCREAETRRLAGRGRVSPDEKQYGSIPRRPSDLDDVLAQ
jgi:hypothetical protein